MQENKVYNESCLETLSRMESNSIDSVITSPPYWQLRDYGYDGQWGLEPTFQEYLEHLWSMMDLIYLKLKPEGTAWINLGDSYHNPTKWTNLDGAQTISNGNARDFVASRKVDQGIPSKCLLLIPHRFAIGCIDRGWIVRNDVIWAKRNGMPESVTDRFSKKHEYFFFMVKSEKYYFDLDAVRDKHKQVSIERMQRGISEDNKWVNGADGQTPHNLSQPRPNITTKIPKEQAEMFGSPRARQHRNNYTSNTQTGGKETVNLGNTHENGKNPGSVSDFWDKSKSYPNRKYFFQENYFETIDTQMKAYWLGFIWADGYLNTNALEVELHIKDIEQLQRFRDDIGSTHKIYERERPTTHSCRIVLGSQKLVSDLISLGYNHKEVPINLPVEYEKDFIRGLFDGDGSVGCYSGYKGKIRSWLELLGKEKLMLWVKEKLDSIGMYDNEVRENKGTFRLSYTESGTGKFYNYIYSGYQWCMERKKVRFPNELNYEFDFFDIPTKPSSSKHYASYNDSLLVKPVLAGCPKGGVIYDPFFGTGSTGEVAIRAGRKFIGSEMSIEYCKIANKRIEPFLLQQSLF
jgi:DNA modification methylase